MASSLIRRIPHSCTILYHNAKRSTVNTYLQQTRNTVILKRKWPVLFSKKGYAPHLKERNKVFVVVEDTHQTKLPDIQCILTQDIDGIGYTNELVNVKRKLFRNVLYPAGLAMYASPENIKDFVVEREDLKSLGSPWARMTLNTLSTMYLTVPMSGDNPWTLNKRHVVVALRLLGTEVDEEAVILPEEPITEPQEFEIQLELNGMEKVSVKSLIILKHKDPSKDAILPDLPPTFSKKERTKNLWEVS